MLESKEQFMQLGNEVHRIQISYFWFQISNVGVGISGFNLRTLHTQFLMWCGEIHVSFIFHISWFCVKVFIVQVLYVEFDISCIIIKCHASWFRFEMISFKNWIVFLNYFIFVLFQISYPIFQILICFIFIFSYFYVFHIFHTFIISQFNVSKCLVFPYFCMCWYVNFIRMIMFSYFPVLDSSYLQIFRFLFHIVTIIFVRFHTIDLNVCIFIFDVSYLICHIWITNFAHHISDLWFPNFVVLCCSLLTRSTSLWFEAMPGQRLRFAHTATFRKWWRQARLLQDF